MKIELRNKLWKQITSKEFEERGKGNVAVFIDTNYNEITYFKLVKVLGRKGKKSTQKTGDSK